jgi:tripartite ATP-independent transporter DctM subunit
MEYVILIFILSIVLGILTGIRVGVVLGGLSFLVGWFFLGIEFFNFLPYKIYGIITNYVLIAVPLFVYMGVVLEKTKIAENLLLAMNKLTWNRRGGLLYSVVIVGAMLGASTGIVGATVVTMGMIGLPVLLKNGYSKALSTGTIAAAGTLGQIIPPSIVLVLLGSVLNVSIGKLFSAAIFPSILLLLLYLIYIAGVMHWNPRAVESNLDTAPQTHSEAEPALSGHLIHTFFFPFLLILTVLGSIVFGLASPTEASAIGALGAMIIALIQKQLNWPLVIEAGKKTAEITGMIFFIMVGAATFALVFRGLGGDQALIGFVKDRNFTPLYFIVLIMVLIFLAGFILDFIEIIFILIPIVLPTLVQLKIDLLWFGILSALVLQSSFLTPPFGFSLFYLKGVCPKDMDYKYIYLGIIPFVAIQLLLVIFLFFYPEALLI